MRMPLPPLGVFGLAESPISLYRRTESGVAQAEGGARTIRSVESSARTRPHVTGDVAP